MRGLQTYLATQEDLALGRLESAQARASELLARYPGHLAARALLGLALLRSGRAMEAREHFEIVLSTDPENARARLGLAECCQTQGDLEQASSLFRRAYAVGATHQDASLALSDGSVDASERVRVAAQSDPLARGTRLLAENRYTEALQAFDETLEGAPLLPEAWLGRLEALWRLASPGAERLAASVLADWPSFIKARLILADLRLQGGSLEDGTDLLHQAQALDPSGAVAQRVLGRMRQYSYLWTGEPSPTAEPQVVAVKAASRRGQAEAASTVASSGSKPASEPTRNPSLDEIKAELNRLVNFMSRDSRSGQPRDALRPTMLIVTHAGAITQRFGEESAKAVAERLAALASAVTTGDHVACTVSLDDAEAMDHYGAKPPEDPRDPRQVKAAIDQLVEGCLVRRGDVRYMLVVGGDSIVPFHRTSNPADDQDEDIYSDAPYATRNGQALMPARALGRIPDCEDAATFLAALDRAISAHLQDAEVVSKAGRRAKSASRRASGNGHGPNLGYTASVWRTAARAVFDTIGEERHLRMSPPHTHDEFHALIGGRPRLAYFNLHGVEGEAPWYGQRDPDFAADYPLFPVALMPEAITSACATDTTVFSEACYGADILGRTPADSIALKFMSAGARAFVGSTRLAYGSLNLPLAGADLLGRYFWMAVLQGMSTGQALQWAKLSFARDVLSRQGYLDAEDQKTLLTFNLLGDPSLAGGQPAPSWDGIVVDGMLAKAPMLSCRNGSCEPADNTVPEELLQSVQRYVAKVLPWLASREIRAARQVVCTGRSSGSCGGNTRATHGPAPSVERTVFTVRGVAGGPQDKCLPQFVKLTVDARGAIVKMAVSK